MGGVFLFCGRQQPGERHKGGGHHERQLSGGFFFIAEYKETGLGGIRKFAVYAPGPKVIRHKGDVNHGFCAERRECVADEGSGKVLYRRWINFSRAISSKIKRQGGPQCVDLVYGDLSFTGESFKGLLRGWPKELAKIIFGCSRGREVFFVGRKFLGACTRAVLPTALGRFPCGAGCSGKTVSDGQKLSA